MKSNTNLRIFGRICKYSPHAPLVVSMSIAGVPVGSKSTVVLAVVIYTGRDEPRGVAVVVSSIPSAAVVVSSIASVL